MAVAGIVGCEDRSAADKVTLDKLQAALSTVSALNSDSTADQVSAANTALTAAAADKSTGPVLQAVADGAVAAFDQQAAFAATLRLKQMETDVRTTLVQLRRLGEQVTTSAAYADAYTRSDPKVALAEFSTHITAMQGSATMLTWGIDEQSKLPTLAAAKAESTRLDGEIAARQEQLKTMQQQRTDDLAAADQQTTHAATLKGEEGVKAYAEASESRRKADDLAVNIELVQDQLNRLKSDAALQQGQIEVVDMGVKALNDEEKLVETDVGVSHNHAAAQKTIATAALEGDDKTKISIKQTAADLKKQLEELAMARSQVLAQLTEADKYADSANGQAMAFATSIATKLTGNGKEADVYKALRNAVHPQQYHYLSGTIARDLGAITTGEAALLSEAATVLDAVKTSIKAAEMVPPSDLDVVDAGSVKQLLDAAEAYYTTAGSSLTDVQSGDASEALKLQAKQALLITLHGHLRLYDLKTAAGDTAAAGLATTMMSDALAIKADLTASNQPLPALPGELGQPTPPAAPATEPAAPTNP